ncbi:rCG36244 [Rattus norvegicus]|uniref:RCG36244 n=1 Tax=Rattus norvegicus TaxID=10116 RepID=A6IPV0_RAT|nr:rCG36244 [Rattus norvegicus]
MFVKETLLKLKMHIDFHKSIGGYINTPCLQFTGHPDKNKTNKHYETNGHNIHLIFHLNTKEYTFSEHIRSFFKLKHILSHQARLNRKKIIEIMPASLSDHHDLKLDFNNRKLRKFTYLWLLNNALFNEISWLGRK